MAGQYIEAHLRTN